MDSAFIRRGHGDEVGTEVEVEGENVCLVRSATQLLEQSCIFSEEDPDERSFFRGSGEDFA
jgi:hypothetical protein